MKQINERNLNTNNQTPLHFAASNESTKIGELLISKGADINSITIMIQYRIKSFLTKEILFQERYLNKSNQTPLHCAAERDLNKIGELLISKGADINVKDIISENRVKCF